MNLTKKFYKIKEVAEILDIPASTLRFWETQFTIINPTRSKHGSRLYTPSDVEKIRLVHFLVKDRGLRLDAAQEQIKHNHSGVSRKYNAIVRLKKIRNHLQSMLDALHDLR